MGLCGIDSEWFTAGLPFFSTLLISIMISTSTDLDMIGFLGVLFTIAVSIMVFTKICRAIYDTWIGVFLGHNVNLRRMGKWAVVTGATDGIGLAFSRQLARRGINVVLMSRSLDRLERCAKEIEIRYGVKTKVIQVDFSQDVYSYGRNVDKELEGMEIGTLINNVGMTYNTPEYFDRVTESVDFVNKMLNLNVTAVTMMTRAVLPGMLDRGKGVIVNVGSLASVEGWPFFSLYAATKAYMETLTLDLAREYGPRGIHFQYQCPGYVTTKIAKIKKSNLFVPTPNQYATRALNSIGLQQHTAVWTPQRFLVPVMQTIVFLFPATYDMMITWLSRTFWLFAKKREMERDPVYSKNIKGSQLV